MKILKECKIHGETTFTLRNSGGKNRYRCNKCAVDAVFKRRKVIKLKAVEYKGGCCEICGYKRSVEALEFHHKDPSKKDFGIGTEGYTRSWDKTRE